MSHFSRGRAFSIVELMVAVAVIAVLVALLIPVLSKSRESARATICGSKIAQLSLMCQLYAIDFQNRFPSNSSSSSSNWNVEFLTTFLGRYYNSGSGSVLRTTATGGGYSSEFGWVNGPLRCPSVTPNLAHSNIKEIRGRWFYSMTANYRLSGLLVRTNGKGYLNGKRLSSVRNPSRVFAIYETPSTVYGDSIRNYFDEDPLGTSAYWSAFSYEGNPRFFHFDDTDSAGLVARKGAANMGMLDGSLKRLTGQQHRDACSDGTLTWLSGD